MAKITRKKLARGTKLQVEQMHGPMASAATQISNANIVADQLQAENSTFRVNLWVPYIGMQLFQPYNRVGLYADHTAADQASIATRSDPGQRPFGIPFILPPTQDLFSTTGTGGSAQFQLDENTPTATLEEISFSFDQRGEPCAVADNFSNDLNSFTHYAPTYASATEQAAVRNTAGLWGSSRYQGSMDFTGLDAYNLKIAIVSKSQYYFGSTARRPEKEIWSLDIPLDAYSGDYRRENPILIDEINQAMHPYKSYAFLLYCDGLNSGEYIGWDNTAAAPGAWTVTSAVNSHALVSVNVSMKFRQKLMTRDTHAGASVVQNIPTADNGVIDSYTLSITQPAAGDKIEADNATDGFSTNLHKIDKVFRDKLKGGYDKEARTEFRQELAQDAGYEVIAVPLMNNRRWGCVLSGYYARSEPYIDEGAVASQQIIADRRFIPIQYPITIEHAFLAWNWMVPGVFGLTPILAQHGGGTLPKYFAGPQLVKPASTTFKVEVGVGLTTFLREDGSGIATAPLYSRVAYHEMVNPSLSAGSTWNDKLIDQMKIHDFSLGDETVGNTTENWDWELHQIPIYTAAGFEGVGHYAQGDAYFAGKSARDRFLRQSTANSVRDAAGVEQMIEIRMHLSDSTNKLTDTRNVGQAAPYSNVLPREAMFSGYQGHFVYLVCKKHLA